jgi:hypothetical protein
VKHTSEKDHFSSIVEGYHGIDSWWVHCINRGHISFLLEEDSCQMFHELQGIRIISNPDVAGKDREKGLC